MGRTYKVKNTGKYISESDVVKENDRYVTKSGELVSTFWEKMSKSKHNGIDPVNILDKYGMDTTRLLILADVAPTSTRNWSEDSESFGDQMLSTAMSENVFQSYNCSYSRCAELAESCLAHC